jgi:4'-phosphopantetheinyl transferase
MTEDFPRPELPTDGAIHLWWVDLDGGAGVDPAPILSAEERERAARFHFAEDASRFRRCRAMLRLGLGWYLGRNPQGIVLRVGKFGKPYVDGGLYFNVSHVGGLGAIAFATRGEVGVDVEAVNRSVEAMEIASSYFTATETASIASKGTEPERNSVFLRLWTRKEAVLKAAGCGIVHGLDRVEVLEDRVSLVAGISGGDGSVGSVWRVRDLPRTDGHWAAIAAADADWSILQWKMGWETTVSRFQTRFPGALPGS